VKGALPRLAIAAMLAPLACAAGELDAGALDRSIQALRSSAQETRMLLAASYAGQVTAAYARVQREEIAKQVRDAAKPLDDPTPQPLAARAANAKALAEKVSSALKDEDVRAAEAAERALAALAKGGK
jgi:hypothetical protein